MFFGRCIEKGHLSARTVFQCFFARYKSGTISKKRSKSPLLQHIRVLEQYVAELSAKLEKHDKQRLLKNNDSDRKSLESEHEFLYHSICNPQNQELALTNKCPILPPILEDKLGDLSQEIDLNTTWTQKLSMINARGGFMGLTTSEVNQIIASITPKERGGLTDVIFSMIKNASIQPDSLTYDFMINGCIEFGNVEKAMNLFSQMKQHEIKPTVFSYAHLMNGYVKIKCPDNALLLFKDMKNYSIEPNLTIYTILISAFLQKRLFNNAWMTFNLLKYRSKDVYPDVKTYSLMIYSCALTGEAERANNLFEEMLSLPDGPLVPTVETYNALIHAFAERKDYFYETWRIAKTMADNNIPMDMKTLNALLRACGKVGDLKKARILAKYIFQKCKCLDDVNIHTFQGLFRAYSNYVPNNQHQVSKFCDSSNSKHDADILISELNMNISNDTKSNFFQDIKNCVFFKSDLNTSKDILNESKALMTYIQKNKYSFLDEQLMNAYLAIPINQGSYFIFKYIYENMYYPITTENLYEESSYLNSNKFKRGPYTYELGLQAAYKFNDLKFARLVWNERENWRHLIENQRKNCEKTNKLFTQEYLNNLDFNIYKSMINILTKNNLLEEAKHLLISSKKMFPWQIDHLKPLWSKVGQIKDEVFKSLILEIIKSGKS
ncbi:uncharacterized protein T551_00928 [Pneumocystis jirovecii RU7]|uniref:Pentacotripeptide-repeat region of PRORP domain-containing protein n=1 Tax=Pneumocystis jirovecii (strain RU7) TaxID=1408657 RepID=A0A0W4ZTK3_PNEJ7|nr:uncharacterized protein T551_00928 [Pneumocystis jirovecii RU7]KTW31667.1 hypothetical protein T551_00928 [Pneumocystis jirovecii RU7]